MSSLLQSIFTMSDMSLTDEHIREREKGLGDVQTDLRREFPGLIDEEKHFKKFSGALKEKLSEDGKAIYGDGLDQAKINQAIAEDFKEEYKTVLEETIEKLKRNIDAKEIVENAQNGLQEKLKQKKSKLVEKLINLLSTNGQDFSTEDSLHLKSGLVDYLKDISQQLAVSLARVQPEAIQARLQLHSANSAKTSGDMTVTGERTALNQLTIAPQTPSLAPAYKIDISDLSKRIKHGLADLKPGEKVNIAIDIPIDRADIEKRIAEQGLQYRIPLVALLLLIFLQLQMVHKDDQTRVFKAMQKLVVDGIAIDSKDIKLKISSIDHNGKTQIHTEELLPHFIQQLEQIRQKFDAQLKQKWSSDLSKKLPSLKPSESGYNSAEDDEDVANTSSSPQLSRSF
jgi:hypothetical protein